MKRFVLHDDNGHDLDVREFETKEQLLKAYDDTIYRLTESELKRYHIIAGLAVDDEDSLDLQEVFKEHLGKNFKF